ncbi:chromosome segregation protein ParM [Kitasatospora sp. NPDC088134]|uniref:chromosome segregation protein ParM n=1 Tax=Kitasatospora sp. NPDC088134 TaxID=3364071 RepID=UPI003825433F
MAPVATTLERTVYVAAAPILGAAASLPPDHPVALGATVAAGVGVAAGLGVVLGRPDNEGRWLVRLSPLLEFAAVDFANYHLAGWHWDAALAGAWLLLNFALKPLSGTSRRHRIQLAAAAAPRQLPAAPAAAPAAQPAETADPFTAGMRQLWARAKNPGDTHVAKAIPHEGKDHDLTLLLRSNEPGRPISRLSEEDVAAALGIDVVHAASGKNNIVFMPVASTAGRQSGPGWLEVQVVPDERERRHKRPTTAEWWDDKIGDSAIPGSRFIDRIRNQEKGVTYWTAQLPDGIGEPRMDLPALCRAMRTTYEEGRVFVTLDVDRVLVAVWDVSPLAKIYPATRELLTPDSDGWWTAGFLANGQPARNRVCTDRGAAHGLYTAPSGAGKTQLMAEAIVAHANVGAALFLCTEAPDEKTAALGRHCYRYGVGALYMVRLLRVLEALIDIRGTMLWADGKVHDWAFGKPGCPYSQVAAFLDEFLSAALNGDYGPDIQELAEIVSVKARKQAIGLHVAGQSIYVQDGFSQLLLENIRENGVPIVLKVAPKKIGEMFKTLNIAPDDIPEPLPRSFSPEKGGRIERIMNGEAEPPSDSNTGGVGWIVPNRKPEAMRALFIDFNEPIDHLFPNTVVGLTDHEIRELEARDLWFDWTLPPRPGEFGPEPVDEDDEDRNIPAPRRKADRKATAPEMPSASSIDNPQDALAAIAALRKK